MRFRNFALHKGVTMSTTRRLSTVAAASTVSLALLLTACGRDSDGGTADATAATISSDAATGTIEVWAMGTEGERLPEIAKKFEAENPDATVKVTPIPWESAVEKINTAIAAGDVPDVLQVGTTLMSEFVDQDGLAPTPAEIDPESFFAGAWDTTVVGGTSYAVPWYVESRVLYYRTDLAATAGVGVPETWDDLTTFAQGMQKAGAEYGIGLQTDGQDTSLMYLPFFWQAGGEIMNSDETEFTLDSDAQATALEFYSSFITNGLAPQHLVNDERAQDFIDGKLGSFIAGPWERANLITVAGEEFTSKFAVTPLPAGETAAGFIGGSNLAVTREAKNPEAAWKFVQYTVDPAVQVEWFGISNDLPSVQSAWDDPALADNDEVSIYRKALEVGRSTPAIPNWSEIGRDLDAIIEQVIAGKVTPKDAATQMQEAATAAGTGLDN